MFNVYPYINENDLNLDYILRRVMEMSETMKNFVALNTIKYASPISWNITTQYSGNTVVVDPNTGIAYISSQPVPAGVYLNNTDYWSVIFDLSQLILAVNQNITVHDDGDNIYATNALNENDWLIWSGVLYRVTQDIPAGAAYVINGNIEKTTIEDFVKRITFVVTPELYGAAGDGITDDTDAIKEALSGGLVVYLNNSYLITDAITIPSGKCVRGNGTVIVDASQTTDGFIMSSNTSIEGIHFEDANESNYLATGHVVYASNVINAYVNNCTFTDIHIGYCIAFERSKQFTANYNNIDGYAYAGISALVSCEHFEFNYNRVYNGQWTGNNNRYPICVSGYFTNNYGPARFCECNYNYIEDVTPLWEGIDSHGVCDSEIIGNTIKNVAYGIALGQPTNAGNLPEDNCRLQVKNNLIEVTTAATGYVYGICVTADQYCTPENVEISNNIIKATGTPNSYSDGTSGIVLLIRGTGITFKDIRIANNSIYGEMPGIAVTAFASSVLENILIENNLISGGTSASREAIRFNNSSCAEYKRVIIRNNVMENHVGYDFVGVLNYAGNELVTYENNTDLGTYSRYEYSTVKRSSISANTKAKGVSGQRILATSGTNAEWLCQNTGSWLLITGTAV